MACSQTLAENALAGVVFPKYFGSNFARMYPWQDRIQNSHSTQLILLLSSQGRPDHSVLRRPACSLEQCEGIREGSGSYHRSQEIVLLERGREAAAVGLIGSVPLVREPERIGVVA